MITKEDKELLKEKGLSENNIYKQIELFKKGTPHIDITRPATLNDGIMPIESPDKWIRKYDEFVKTQPQILKFVPASGAATRMFKAFFAYVKSNEKSLSKFPEIQTFCDNIEKFAFFDKLNATSLKHFGKNVKNLLKEGKTKQVINILINTTGLNYGHTPKGLIDFHKYPENEARTAFVEHLYEGAKHIAVNNNAYYHFTISPAFEKDFKKQADEHKITDEIKNNISFSFQSPATDTIAVDDNYNPVRTPNGQLLFRPGGHGSLIHNLAEQEADLIFIKNIDNIAHADYIEDTIKYKKILGGIAIEIKTQITDYINQLKASTEVLPKVKTFLQKNYLLDILPEFNNITEEQKFYLEFLNRPIRIAGMVKNEGEPGGGPFWVKHKSGQFSTLQIVEKSQIDLTDTKQKEILEKSTHFNPVDMVVIFDKNTHNLLDYIDNNTYFISEKSYEGKTIKALEWPGLWNGAMSDWLTIFVEIPLETFNPVKIVTDLLRKYHQPKGE